MLENINYFEVLFWVAAYICVVMPFIYWLGGNIRKHNNCNIETGEPLD